MEGIATSSPLYPLVLEIRALQERVAKLEAAEVSRLSVFDREAEGITPPAARAASASADDE